MNILEMVEGKKSGPKQNNLTITRKLRKILG